MAVWLLPATAALLTAARPPTVNMGFPRGRYIRSQDTKGTPNGSTSALNMSSPSGGGSTSSDRDTPLNSGGSLKGGLSVTNDSGVPSGGL